MKKSLTLLAILGLLSICLVSSLYAAAPVIADLPDLKLFQNQGLSSAFDLQAFNNVVDQITNASVSTQFAGAPNSIVVGSSATLAGTTSTFTVAQSQYANPTVGTYVYAMSNSGGNTSGTSKAKWATFKIKKLPKIGLTVGSSYAIDLIGGGYVSPSLPASFGNAAAITVSDLSKVTAVWTNASTVTITQLAAATGPVNVDITAAPSASAPFGTNIDKERIEVYTNLLPNSTFSTAADTATFGYEPAPGKATQVNPAFVASAPDGAGNSASGVAQFTFADNLSGIKATPFTGIPYAAGQWYIERMRVAATAANSNQLLLFNFNNLPVVGNVVDVDANVLFGIPTTYTWVEAPVLALTVGTGYAQFQMKAAGASVVNVDEIQIINATPALVDAKRGSTRLRYVFGDFDVSSDTTGWGSEGYALSGGQTPLPGISVGTSLQLDFTGAGAGTLQKGIKWTANNGVGGGAVYAGAAIPGNQVGIKAVYNKKSGNFNDLSAVVLLAVYGVSSAGASDYTSAPGGQIIASAQFGGINNGLHYAIGQATRSFYLFQFGTKNDQSSTAEMDEVDLITANDDPPFGDATLYP